MTWNKRPLHDFIFSIIRRQKSISFDKLWKSIQSESDNISKSEIKTILIKLEIWDKIKVFSESDNNPRIIFNDEEKKF